MNLQPYWREQLEEYAREEAIGSLAKAAAQLIIEGLERWQAERR